MSHLIVIDRDRNGHMITLRSHQNETRDILFVVVGSSSAGVACYNPSRNLGHHDYDMDHSEQGKPRSGCK